MTTTQRKKKTKNFQDIPDSEMVSFYALIVPARWEGREAETVMYIQCDDLVLRSLVVKSR